MAHEFLLYTERSTRFVEPSTIADWTISDHNQKTQFLVTL
jgi:hypothetical protein